MSPQFTPFAMFLLFMIPIAVGSAVFPVAKEGCKEYVCGNVEIPYPFGMSEDCYLDDFFMVTCDRSHYDPPKLFLGDSNINITKISLEESQLHIPMFIGRICYSNSGEELTEETLQPTLSLSKNFTINNSLNKLTVVGCDTSAFLQGKKGSTTFTTGCISFCNNASDVGNHTCSGGGCCQTSIPDGLRTLDLTVSSYYNHKYVDSFNPCSYAFVVEEGQFNFSLDSFDKLRSTDKLPMVLDWAIGGENGSCKQNLCHEKNTRCQNMAGRGGYRCFCKEGYRGNPYLLDIIGCQNINECEERISNCSMNAWCEDTEGGYKCICQEGYKGDGMGKDGCSPKGKGKHLAWIVAGTAIGIAVLSVVCSLCHHWLRAKELIEKREMNFRKNGGTILLQKINGQEGSSIPTKIFSAEELMKATKNYHDSHKIGQGGNGIVYKGCLTDNTEVAIKKSKTVDHENINQFINEVIILTQINHRNVVKVLGCCLEDEHPSLVYEFISSGTIFEHLHTRSKSCVLSWDARLSIASETAGAISYLHSAASPPIIHRDIKTTNILLDDNYTAKVADFGASRLVPLNGAELSTMVQGTIGYLDPEYLQTSQLTEKSDVYSFGVVLVELLTGKKPISFDKAHNQISLANNFLSSLKLNQLFQVLDDFIVSEDNTEQLKEVAMLAKRCLNVKGEDRPTMKEVSMELEWLRTAVKHSWIQNAGAGSEEMESLLGSQSNALTDGGIMMIDSIKFCAQDHKILPIANGR